MTWWVGRGVTLGWSFLVRTRFDSMSCGVLQKVVKRTFAGIGCSALRKNRFGRRSDVRLTDFFIVRFDFGGNPSTHKLRTERSQFETRFRDRIHKVSIRRTIVCRNGPGTCRTHRDSKTYKTYLYLYIRINDTTRDDIME